MTALLREKTASVPRDIGAFDPGEVEDPEVKEKISGNPFQTRPWRPADTGRVLATFDGARREDRGLPSSSSISFSPMRRSRGRQFEKSDDVVKLIRKLVGRAPGDLEARAAQDRPAPRD